VKAKIRIDTAIVALCILTSFVAGAQVPPAPLSGVRVDATVSIDGSTKVYTFRYRVTNPSQNVLSISSVVLDITLPANATRPTGGIKLPAGPAFRDPDRRGSLTPTSALPYSSWGDDYRAETGLNFVPVGLSSPTTWSWYGVVPSDDTRLLGKAIKAAWSGVNQTPTSLEGVGISPGDSLDGFVVTSFGPPGIRRMEFQPSLSDLEDARQIPDDWEAEEGDPPEVLRQKDRLVNSLGYLTSTVGPTALPVEYTNPILVTRLQGLVDQCTSLSWITDAALTQQLTRLLTQAATALNGNDAATAKARLQQFITSVTSASLDRRRQEASDLLSLNAQFIVDNITVPKH
jgi:hypothetical protein